MGKIYTTIRSGWIFVFLNTSLKYSDAQCSMLVMWNSHETTKKYPEILFSLKCLFFNFSVCHTYVEIEATVHIFVGSRFNLHFMMTLLLQS